MNRFAIVREMLSNLGNITTAGQQHDMGKIVRFIEAEASDALRDMRTHKRVAFSELLAGLRHESARLAPDVPNFVRRAEAASTLLAART